MAERRMFAKTIVDSDAFLDMPLSTQALYFHFGMRADDDGFVNNPKKIQRMVGASDDDFRVLVAKRFIIRFDSGVVVIKHWRIHNYIQKDRYKETVYQEEYAALSEKDNGAYTLDTDCIQNGYSLDTQVRLGEVSEVEGSPVEGSKGKERRSTSARFTPPTLDELKDYVWEKGYHFDPEAFMAYYESNGWKVGRNSMKNWKSACKTWEARQKEDKRNANDKHDDMLKNWAERGSSNDTAGFF